MENYSSWKLIVFGIVMTLVIGCITLSDAQCNPTSGGVKRFGANCEFRCHCLNSSQCDVKTGYCTSGCDFEWTGPDCQYRNIALGKVSRHSGNINPPQYSDRANDRDVTTCSVTGNISARISVAPWWALRLPNNVTFKEFVFTTEEQSLPDFPGFNVSVQQDVSENDHLKKIYHKGQTCYHHNNSIPKNRSVHVNCTQELYGNQLRLQLANTYTQLVICDLRVSGECKDRKWGKRCQKTCGFCLNLSLCDGTSGDCREGCELGYKDTPKCTTVCDAGKYGLSCNRNCSANCVDVCNNVNGRCSSCKAGWKGEYCSTVCDAGKYGLSCNRNCSANCVDVCNNVNGRCSSCKAGWKGDYCSTVCDAGKYGLSCNRNCSANCVDVCNNVNGRCSSCKAGWKGDYCSTVCDAGKYGLSCNRNCSANCVDVCNNVNGRCSSCKAGWKGDYCSTVCHSDEYGKNCLERCSDNCIDRNCDKKNGTCTNGCIPGFTGEMCKQELLKKKKLKSTLEVFLSDVAWAQSYCDAYGSIHPGTEAVPPVIMADQSAQNQLASITTDVPQIIADLNQVPVNEPTIVPEQYTSLEGRKQVDENKQNSAGTEAAVGTIKIGEVSKVAQEETNSANKEMSMSRLVLEKDVGKQEENQDEDSSVIETEAPAKETRGHGRRERQSSGKSNESEEKATTRKSRTTTSSKSIEEVVEEDEKKQYLKHTRSSANASPSKAGRGSKNQIEEVANGDEDVEDFEEMEHEETSARKGRGRSRKSTEDAKATPSPKGKGRGRKKNTEDVAEETPSTEQGSGQPKKVVKEEIEDDEVEMEEVEEMEEVIPFKRRGMPSKTATPIQNEGCKKGTPQKTQAVEVSEEEEFEEKEIEEELEEENRLIIRKRAPMIGIDLGSSLKKLRTQIMETDVKQGLEEEEEIKDDEEIEDDEEMYEDDEEYEQVMIRRAQQGTENDSNSFEDVDQVPQSSKSQQINSIEQKPAPDYTIEMEEENRLIVRKRAQMIGIDLGPPLKKLRTQIMETDVKQGLEEEEEIEDDEEMYEDDEEYEQAMIRRAQQGTENDSYSFEDVDQVPRSSKSQQPDSIEQKPAPDYTIIVTDIVSESEYESDTIPVDFPQLSAQKISVVEEQNGGFTAEIEEDSVVKDFTQKDPEKNKPLTSVIELEDDIDDEDVFEDEIIRDMNNPGLYIKKVRSCGTTKGGKVKKESRVYNSYHYCTFCDKLVSNYSQHMKRKHMDKKDVKKVFETENGELRKRKLAHLSAEMDNKNNLKNKRKGKGEILLFRRPVKTFVFDCYGPCPKCYLWVSKKMMTRHQKSCIAEDTGKLSSADMLTRSDIMAERIKETASPALVNEVFKYMHNDAIGKLAREDLLVICLGNMWLEKNVGNKLKRGRYTSQIMRLVSRLLINIRKETGTCYSLSEYLKPFYFNDIAKATLLTAGQGSQDAEYLENPSNAIKLGHDIKRLVNINIGLATLRMDKTVEEEGESFLRTMRIFWGTRVTKLGRTILVERQFNKRPVLPDADDLQRLNMYLNTELSLIDENIIEMENYAYIANLLCAKLVQYNRRRPGEIEAITLEDYGARVSGTKESTIVGDLSIFEKHLMESQDVVTTRGKGHRGVPIIVPEGTKRGMKYIANSEIRKAVGINRKSPYLFANAGDTRDNFRVYDALSEACSNADLKYPERITATTLRKYMATITQVLDLKPHQLEWVMKHMGHSLDIHKIYYRCTSDVIERTKIAKILLLQDSGRLAEFCNQSLDDIQLSECVVGKYGLSCNRTCSANCVDVCNKVKGTCSSCKAGWKGDNCTTDCEDGKYGISCSRNCSTNCVGVCNKTNGTCPSCEAGWKGDNCTTEMQMQSFPVAGVAGGASAVVVLIAFLVVVGLILSRQRIQNKHDKTVSYKDGILSPAAVKEDATHQRESKRCQNTYVNAVELHEKLHESHSVTEASVVGENEAEYINDSLHIHHVTKCGIPISDFKAYVKTGLATKEYFVKQFQEIPYGMQYPATKATMPGNVKKNRYKLMYAYDHSRVILKKIPGQANSDYINATNIKGYSGVNVYIAAQGPIIDTLEDFWRMIWEKNVHTIIMVTNLSEEGKMKCKQYWPEANASVQHGNIIAFMESEDVYTEFTVRRLKVSHGSNPGRQRTVTQFHYTAWPDKDVPRCTSSLLYFWYQVRKHDEKKTDPWLVHCSAGVGRTGTFIAIDILYDQGKDKGFIDVYNCVSGLREQRVNLVQTKDQYKFLHSIMVEALVLPWQPVHIEKFDRIYDDLKQVEQTTGKTHLLLQYETLSDEPEEENVQESQDEMYTSAKRTENRSKNRYDNILAPNDFRPFLSTHVPGCTDYINAVYIPGYRHMHGYIVTQMPLTATAVDCCRLILEDEIQIIVTFEDDYSKEVEKYLPETGNLKIGPFSIKFVSEEEKIYNMQRNYEIKYRTKKHTITQLIFKRWLPSRLTPAIPNEMLGFLQELEQMQRQTDSKPVLVQCLNGAERSGLVVVMMNILERVRFDKEVSIIQVIRQLKKRRQQIIPNFEQFKFCHDVLLSYVQCDSTYANM